MLDAFLAILNCIPYFLRAYQATRIFLQLGTRYDSVPDGQHLDDIHRLLSVHRLWGQQTIWFLLHRLVVWP